MSQLGDLFFGTPVRLRSALPYAQCKAKFSKYPTWNSKRAGRRKVGWMGHLVMIWPRMEPNGPSGWLWLSEDRSGTLIRGRASNGPLLTKWMLLCAMPTFLLLLGAWQFMAFGEWGTLLVLIFIVPFNGVLAWFGHHGPHVDRILADLKRNLKAQPL